PTLPSCCSPSVAQPMCKSLCGEIDLQGPVVALVHSDPTGATITLVRCADAAVCALSDPPDP
ncbi:MAG: hypothetical protein ACRD1T_06420, partial [Acidimicrobiia bacterium]